MRLRRQVASIPPISISIRLNRQPCRRKFNPESFGG